ncbi:hypothetical protein RI367_000991 [Sorochytrium milnesiophthora]
MNVDGNTADPHAQCQQQLLQLVSVNDAVGAAQVALYWENLYLRSLFDAVPSQVYLAQYLLFVAAGDVVRARNVIHRAPPALFTLERVQLVEYMQRHQPARVIAALSDAAFVSGLTTNQDGAAAAGAGEEEWFARVVECARRETQLRAIRLLESAYVTVSAADVVGSIADDTSHAHQQKPAMSQAQLYKLLTYSLALEE